MFLPPAALPAHSFQPRWQWDDQVQNFSHFFNSGESDAKNNNYNSTGRGGEEEEENTFFPAVLNEKKFFLVPKNQKTKQNLHEKKTNIIKSSYGITLMRTLPTFHGWFYSTQESSWNCLTDGDSVGWVWANHQKLREKAKLRANILLVELFQWAKSRERKKSRHPWDCILFRQSREEKKYQKDSFPSSVLLGLTDHQTDISSVPDHLQTNNNNSNKERKTVKRKLSNIKVEIHFLPPEKRKKKLRDFCSFSPNQTFLFFIFLLFSFQP